VRAGSVNFLFEKAVIWGCDRGIWRTLVWFGGFF